MARSQFPRRPRRPAVEAPNPIDVHIGARLRLRRRILSLSQEQLGEAIGLTFQQIQKYERGTTRIGASRLFELSRVLDVPVSFFFDDTDLMHAPAMGDFAKPLPASLESDLLRKPEAAELVQAYWAIKDTTVRRHLFDLVTALAAESDMPDEKRARAMSAS